MANQLGTAPGGAQLATQITTGGGAGGGVTQVTATTPIVSSGGATPNITHADTAVTPGAYTNATVTVNQKGHVTAASSGTAPVTDVTGTAPIVSSGGATPAISHAASGVTAAAYTNASVTVDAKGHVTAAASGTAPVTNVTGTSPIVSSGGATPAISISKSGTVAGRAGLMVLIDRINVAGVATYTSPSWAAELYAQLIIDVDGAFSGGGYLDFRPNNDTTVTNYVDQGIDCNGTASADSAFKTEAGARCLVVGTSGAAWHDHIVFNPLVTGRVRHGTSHGTSDASGASISSGYLRITGFQWRDTGTAVTSVTLATQAGTMTAVGYLWGILA